MAISYVGGVQGGRAGSNSTTTQSLSGTLTGGSNTSPLEGDFVLVCCSVGWDTTAATSQAISGDNSGAYSNEAFQSANGTTYDSGSQCNYQFMGATPDTSLTIPATASVRNAQRWIVHVFRGVDATTPMDVAAVPATGTGTGRPDPAAITPATAGAWIVAFYASAAATGSAYTAPTDFATDWLGGTTADTADCMQGGGYYTGWTSGSYNPAAITAGGTTNAADSWTAMALALRPQPAAQTLTQSNSFTNSNTLNYTHTISTATDLTQSSSFTNSNTLNYTHTVTPGEVTVTQDSRFDNTNTYYTHVISQAGADQTVTQSSRFDNSNGLAYQHTVTTGEVTLSQSASFENTNTLNYTHVVSQVGADQNLTQSSSYSNSNTLNYQHTVTPGEVTLTQSSRYDNSATFYIHAISTVVDLVQSSRADEVNTFFTHVLDLQGGAQSLTQSNSFTNSNSFYTHTLSVGTVTLTQDSTYTNVNVFNTHVITQTYLYPPVEYVLAGIVYGPTATEYIGTLPRGATGVVFDIATNNLIKVLNSNTVMTL